MPLSAALDREFLRRRWLAIALGTAVVGLAVGETANALVAPSRVPSRGDWTQAAAKIRSEYRPGDLVVTAPAWADPVMRLELGDLVPPKVAGRMDAARYGRVWELSQRGARAPEADGRQLVQQSRFGTLTLRCWEKPAAMVTFDFLAEWRQAGMAVVRPDGVEIPCTLGVDRFACMGATLRSELLEIDTTLREALSVEPVAGATLALEYPAVTLGRELALAAGLHNVWLRKSGEGKVRLRVLGAGRELGTLVATSASGWEVRKLDTSAWAGQTVPIRFEITVDDPHARHLGFAAEARNP